MGNTTVLAYFLCCCWAEKNLNIKEMLPARQTSTLCLYDHASKMKQIELIR